jgi:DNA-binding NarL/FixJ family response regulator
MGDEASTIARRVLIADDHALVREGIRMMLTGEPGIEVIAEAQNGREALELCRELRPDLVLMDVRMPEMDGLEATRAIKGELPTTSVLVVTSNESPDYLLDAIRAGAAGYVLKEATRSELIDSVLKVLGGEPTIDQGLAMRILTRVAEDNNRQGEPYSEPAGETAGERRDPSPPPPTARPAPTTPPPVRPLSSKELEAVRLLAVGKTNREIAQTMMVSLSSVKTYIKRVMDKLVVSDRTQAAVRAIELGLIADQERSHQER